MFWQKEIETMIANKIIAGEVDINKTYLLDYKKDSLILVEQ